MHQSLLKSPEIDYDLLYPGHEPPHLRGHHVSLSVTIAKLLDEIPGWYALPYVDIYDPYNPQKWRQPDVTILDYPFPKGTIHLDTMAVPQMVLEITSPSTREHDLVTKVPIYKKWQIPIYIIFDSETKEVIIHKIKEIPSRFKANGQKIRITSNVEIAWDGEDNFQAYWENQQLKPNMWEIVAKEQEIIAQEQEIIAQEQANKAKDSVIAKQAEALSEKDRLLAEQKKLIDKLSRGIQ
jgi:hypothetical protein